MRAFDLACNLRWIGECLQTLLVNGLQVPRTGVPTLTHARPGQVGAVTGATNRTRPLSPTMSATVAELAQLEDGRIGYGLVRRCAACDEKLVLAAEAQWATFPAATARHLPPHQLRPRGAGK